MTNQERLAYTDRELVTVDVLRRNQMAWIMFFFLLVVFSVVLGCFIYAAFWRSDRWLTELILGSLDGLIGWMMKHLVTFLYPTASQTTEVK
jgi:hypothetical protein